MASFFCAFFFPFALFYSLPIQCTKLLIINLYKTLFQTRTLLETRSFFVADCCELQHLAHHVVEDAAVREVRQLHLRVEPNHNLELTPVIQLQRENL